jgi:sphinganine-1-phosphate aldolase
LSQPTTVESARNEEPQTHARLPEKGRDREDILRELTQIAAREDARWETGQISGSYYHAGKSHFSFLNEIFGLFSHVNILQRDMCPSGTKFEAEIVSMTAKMLNADAVREPDEVVGAVTAGGSESIMLPMLAYREKAREERGVTAPEMVVPSTAHPAFDKGAHYFGIKLIKVSVGPDLLADVNAMRARINHETIAIAGSAGNYPHGLIDPLNELSTVALELGIPMHVDGCYGGFLLPWIERLGYAIPPCDFRLPGVTSMSCDTHKWGYGPKGASVVLYRNRALRHFQYFSVTDWAGGLYASPTFAGSRSEGISAATWAAMVTLGEDGYIDIARQIMNVADAIQQGARAIPEIKIAGHPTFCIAFLSDTVDMYHANDYLVSKGWRMNVLRSPPGFHFCITRPQTVPGLAERFLGDLREAVAYAKLPHEQPARSGAAYGGGGTPLDPAILNPFILDRLDAMYKL